MSRKKRETKLSLQHPNTLVVLSVVFLVSVLSIITILGPSSVTGNTIQPLGYMTTGEPLHLAVKDVPGLELIFTNAAETIKNGKIVVEVDDSISFDRPYVTKFNVTSADKFGPLRFTFKVKELDLYDKGIGLYDLRVYHDNKEYPTELLKQSYGYISYIASVPDMGKFVLGKVAPEEKAEEMVKEPLPTEETIVSEPETPPSEEAVQEVPEEEPLVGKAAEVPAEKEEKGVWARIADFFRRLFS